MIDNNESARDTAEGAVLRRWGGATCFEETDKRAENGGKHQQKELGVTSGVLPGPFHVAHMGATLCDLDESFTSPRRHRQTTLVLPNPRRPSLKSLIS